MAMSEKGKGKKKVKNDQKRQKCIGRGTATATATPTGKSRVNRASKGLAAVGKRAEKAKTPSVKVIREIGQVVVGIDPGLTGAIVVTDGGSFFEHHAMPVSGEHLIDIGGVRTVLKAIVHRHGQAPVFLERALPMAMGAKHAFNYGRSFEVLVQAVQLEGLSFVMVEPSEWAREMLAGIAKDLRPKARALQGVKRLYPALFAQLPLKPKGGIQDGPVDALMIAGYGLRKLGIVTAPRGPVVVTVYGGGGGGGSGGTGGVTLPAGAAEGRTSFQCHCGRDGIRVHGEDLCSKHMAEKYGKPEPEIDLEKAAW